MNKQEPIPEWEKELEAIFFVNHKDLVINEQRFKDFMVSQFSKLIDSIPDVGKVDSELSQGIILTDLKSQLRSRWVRGKE